MVGVILWADAKIAGVFIPFMTLEGISHVADTFAPDALPEAAIRSVGENGYVIVDRLVSEAAMDIVQSEMRRYIEKTTFVHPDEAGRRMKRTGALVARSPAARSLVMNKLVRAVCGAIILGKDEFQLSLTEIISILPGAKSQPIHRDEVGFGSFPFPQIIVRRSPPCGPCPTIRRRWAQRVSYRGATPFPPTVGGPA